MGRSRAEGSSPVRGFQQALGITVDGIVGQLTWRALVSGMLSF
jgi:peptidoglycan hydrolase-like protein with peptidoglycan-binding domain